MTEVEVPTAAVLIIGNEILSGRTQDVNLNYIAKKLTSVGIRLREARLVTDSEAEIIAAVNALRKVYTYVFTTGGIGPTHDDITADAIAKAFGVEAEIDPVARTRLEEHYKSTNLNAARLRMARVPQGSFLIANPVSAAPGFCIENVFVLAGVPHIMQAMMDGIAAELRHGPAIYSFSVSGYVAESTVAEDLGVIAERYPSLEIGSYPWVRLGRFGTALVVRGMDKDLAQKAVKEIFALVAKLGGEPELTPGVE